MSPSDADLDDARRIARHLVGEEPRPGVCARWLEALEVAAAPLARERDRRLWALARRPGPWLGLVDAGLALTDPHSPVRQRLCLMLAILEASPAHVGRFLERDLSPVAFLPLAARGVLAGARSAAGLLVVRSWGVLWR